MAVTLCRNTLMKPIDSWYTRYADTDKLYLYVKSTSTYIPEINLSHTSHGSYSISKELRELVSGWPKPLDNPFVTKMKTNHTGVFATMKSKINDLVLRYNAMNARIISVLNNF